MGVSIDRRLLLNVYSLIYAAGLVLYSGVVTVRRLTGGRRSPLLPRLGLSTIPARAAVERDGPCVWIHAVSVGELNAMRPLIRALSALPRVSLLLSTTTSTGQALAQRDFSEQATIFYFPLDLRRICRRYLRRLKPTLVVLAETELWPNFLTASQLENVPVVLVNGRLSDTSFRRYHRFNRFFHPVIQSVSHFCMQTKEDKQRILELGAEPERVNWVGNLKFDYHQTSSPEQVRLNEALSRILRRQEGDLLLVCGSTKPGEEEQLARVGASLRAAGFSLKLIVAPRHPHRGAEVTELMGGAGFATVRRSTIDIGSQRLPAAEAVVLDSIGELAGLYEIADLVFIGGSLVPEGGQNIIEPAAFGRPILFGPHMDNFREIAAVFTSNYGALQVGSAEELEARLSDLLKDSHAREWLGRNARKVIRDNQGAVDRTLEILKAYL
ncbi:MAG: 3-deoxy-D-manno-octulosonic acid transferase [Acidobacteriota bacterium]